MSNKDYYYLSGGNPSGAFKSAAEEVMRRAMPYMGKYNELYRRSSRPYKSVASGLSEDLQVPVKEHNLFFCHGVKEAASFSALYINMLADELTEKLRAAGHKPPKFKFLIRTPSYKYIVSQYQGFNSFECEFVSSFDTTDLTGNGVFHQENYLDNIWPHIKSPKPFEFVIGYLDINPCNPTGYVRGMDETTEAAVALTLIREKNRRYILRTLGKVHLSREPFVIVEDHIYRGLEYDGYKTSSFCQIEEFQNITQTMFGVAKYGLVGMRGCVTVAPKADVEAMRMMFDDKNSDLSPFSVLACEYMFGDNKEDKSNREKYLKQKTKKYEHHALLAVAIIDGKARDFLSPTEYETALMWLTKYGKLEDNEAHKLLEKGIKGIDVITQPQSGFFLALNYNGLINFSKDEQGWLSTNIINFIREAAHYKFSMNIGDAEYMGLHNEFDAVMRFTIALTPAELTKRLLRLNELSKFMDQIGPLNTDAMPDPRGHLFTREVTLSGNYEREKPIILKI